MLLSIRRNDNIGQRNNLYGERSQVVQALARLLDQIKPDGTPGTRVPESEESE